MYQRRNKDTFLATFEIEHKQDASNNFSSKSLKAFLSRTFRLPSRKILFLHWFY